MHSLSLVILYLKQNTLLIALGSYFLFSVLLKSYLHLDITIPCMYKLFTGNPCWGCGLTRACVHLSRLDLHAAYHSNPLVYILLPIIFLIFFIDFYKFKKVNRF